MSNEIKLAKIRHILLQKNQLPEKPRNINLIAVKPYFAQ